MLQSLLAEGGEYVEYVEYARWDMKPPDSMQYLLLCERLAQAQRELKKIFLSRMC